MDSEGVAQALEEMGVLLELRGENAFRCRAYQTAAGALRNLPEDLGLLLAEGRLGQVPGIGETMLAKVRELAATGKLAALEELRVAIPPGMLELTRIPGLGPKKIKVLHDEMGIACMADLKAGIDSGKVALLKGFGAKTAAKLLEGIAFAETSGSRILQSTAWRLALPQLAFLKETAGVTAAEVCGSLRRRADTIGDLDLLFAAKKPAKVLDAFAKRSGIETVLVHGETKVSVRLAGQVQCDVRGVSPEHFPFALNYFTGSKAHNIALRRRAQQRGLKLSEYALEGDGGPIACKDEEALYRALGLAYVPPELREDAGEIAAAEAGALPTLIERGDLTGTFHCHTDWSDGGNTLDEMAEAARALGFKYLGIADHSRSAGYAGGLSIERVHAQWKAINALNARLAGSIRVFKGIECDILADGSLDFPDDVLEGFEYVVASVHSIFGQPKDVMTERICRALSHPRVTMLGHSTGRLLLGRAGYAVDLDRVIEVAAMHGKMIEINANPHRLDLDAPHCRQAKAAGGMLVINPDAHATGEIALVDFGVSVARRGWLEKKDVFNTRPLKDVERMLAARP
jgi:DNA polymerase (family 10)